MADEMTQNSNMQQQSSSKMLWWIVGIVVVLAVGYWFYNSMGSSDSGSTADTGSHELSASELAEIPATGEELVEETVTDESDDVDLGEELV